MKAKLPQRSPRPTWKRLILGYVVIAPLALAPIFSVIVASVAASHLGCRLDEGNPHPCLFRGTDIGNTLYAMIVVGWLGIVSVPLGGVAAAIVTAVVLSRSPRRPTGPVR